MYATIIESGDTYPVDTITPQGVYLRIAGHARYLPAAAVAILPFTF